MQPQLPSRCSKVLLGHTGSVFVAKFDKTGEYCLSGGSDKVIRLWNPALGQNDIIQGYLGHSWEISDLAISHDNKTFASCGGDRTVFFWDVASGRMIRKFQGHYQRINCVDFNEDASVIASGSYDKSVRLWDSRAPSRFPIQVLEDAKDSVSSLQILGGEIIVGSVDGHVRIYDIRQGRLLIDPIGEVAVTSVRFLTDANCYIASCLDDSIKLIDKSDGNKLNTFVGHRNHDYKVTSTLSNTDAHVLSGSEDGKVYIWDLVSAKVTRTLAGHTGTVSSVVYHPKLQACLTAGFDGTIRYWTA